VSFGVADCATIVARDVALADATASGLGNRVHSVSDLKSALEWALSVPGVDGAVVVFGEHVAALGDVELVPLGAPSS
jgi:uncharacterized protein